MTPESELEALKGVLLSRVNLPGMAGASAAERWPLERLARWVGLAVSGSLLATGIVLYLLGRDWYLFNAGGLTIVLVVGLLNRDSASRTRAVAPLAVVFLVGLGVGIALAVQ